MKGGPDVGRVGVAQRQEASDRVPVQGEPHPTVSACLNTRFRGYRVVCYGYWGYPWLVRRCCGGESGFSEPDLRRPVAGFNTCL